VFTLRDMIISIQANASTFSGMFATIDSIKPMTRGEAIGLRQFKNKNDAPPSCHACSDTMDA